MKTTSNASSHACLAGSVKHVTAPLRTSLLCQPAAQQRKTATAHFAKPVVVVARAATEELVWVCSCGEF